MGYSVTPAQSNCICDWCGAKEVKTVIVEQPTFFPVGWKQTATFGSLTMHEWTDELICPSCLRRCFTALENTRATLRKLNVGR